MRLAAAVADLTAQFENHSHPDLEANVEELATALLGPMKSKLKGNGRDEEQGLVWKVNEGRLRMELPTWTKWVAFLLVVVNIADGLRGVMS